MPYSAHSHYCFQESAEAEPATRAKGFFGRPGRRIDDRRERASEAEIVDATSHTKRYEKAYSY